ncbi:MAG: DUF2088 domain-containing protein [Myxococcales bacterium]|nr:DUF2088 domain-containing protein [Myxococcales bacterium]
MSSFAERALAELPGGLVSVHTPRPAAAGTSVLELCRAALASPIGAAPLAELARDARRIAVLVSDGSRDEPRPELLGALREVLPWERVTLVVASGTHAANSDVIPELHRDRPVVVFGEGAECEDLGRTSRGTRIRILVEVARADLVVSTGRLRPHYFAGFSGGAKSVFPGCALAEDVLANHRLKAHPSARLGQVDDNVCRLDMEEAAGALPGRTFLLNVLCDVDGNPVAAAAGDLLAAHRSLIPRARELFTVRAPKSRVVIVADRPPVSRSLYQASKLLPPAGALLEAGGVVILVADLSDGVGPHERVMRGIYELGVRPQLPAGHRVYLVSELPRSVTETTYAEPRDSLEGALRDALSVTGARCAVALWRAGELVAEAE